MFNTFFSKKQKEEQKEAIPDNTSSEPKLNEIQTNLDPKLLAKIETVIAEVEANKELRSVYDERFARIDEQFGEMKGMMVDREKDLQDLEVVATKSADLVNDVQPQKILSEVKKNDLKIDSVKAKLETFESMNDSIMEELKKLRRSVEVFRGTEEIVKLNKQISEEIIGIQRVKSEVVRHSDKIESVYLDVSTKFEDFKKYKDIAKIFEERFEDIEKQFNQIKIKAADIVTKSDFASVSATADESIKNVEETLKNQTNTYKEFIKLLETKTEKILQKRLKEQKKQLIDEMKQQFKKQAQLSKKIKKR